MYWSIATAALAAVLLGVAPNSAPLLQYSAPAGERPAGTDAVLPTTAILPSGRIAAPAGKSVFVGTNPLGMALSPDGRYAIVSNDDERSGVPAPHGAEALAAGYSLTLVDTATMTAVSQYRDPAASFFMGIAALRDPRDPSQTLVLASDGEHGLVRTFGLDTAGRLTPEQPIALPSIGGRKPCAAGIAVTSDQRTAYVSDTQGNAVSAIDLASRTVTKTVSVGYAPLSVAAAGDSVLSSGGGLGMYATVTTPQREPQFAPPAFVPNASSSVYVLGVGAQPGDPATATVVPMERAPDGSDIVGGAAPGAIVMPRDGKLAYVALSNVDRIAVLSLEGGAPHVVRGLDLRLYPEAPYGAQPSAEALSPNGKRLYVALAGLNAVAVLDARAPVRYRYGLIPTAWYPTAVAISPNGRYLYVATAKGVDGWGMLSRIDLKHTSLVKATMATLRYNRLAKTAESNSVVPPLRSGKRSTGIEHVVYISVGPQSYDGVLGDLKDAAGMPLGNGDAAYVRYPQSVTPNLHALAATYAVADNFYAPDVDNSLAAAFALGADAPLYANLFAGVHTARGPMGGGTDDPEDFTRSGSLFNAVARAGLSYRDYGGLLHLSGYAGGLYHLDVPALAALRDNVDPSYDADDSTVDAAHRAQEFVRDMARYANNGTLPSFTYVRLPALPSASGVADADRALGTIVEFLSRTPQWSSTAVFIVPEGSLGMPDHVNPLRGYAVVVSPYVHRNYVGHAHLYAAGVVKTEEEILGLPPLTLNDLLATDLADFFGETPISQAYRAIP